MRKPETGRSRSKGARFMTTPTSNINIGPRTAEALGIKSTAMDMVNDLLGNNKPAPPAPPVAPVVTPRFDPLRTVEEMLGSRVKPVSPSIGRTQSGAGSQIEALIADLARLTGGTSRNNMPVFDPIELPKFNPTAYQGQAESAVNKQFDPVISELLRQQGVTKNRAKSNQSMVGDLYNDLAAYIAQDSATTAKGYDTSQAQSKQLYEDERNKLAALYAQDAASQRNEARRLGIETLGATDEEIAKQNTQKQFSMGQQSQQMQSTFGALEQQQQAAADYDRAMQQASRSEGAEAQRDIISQLEDYMTQSNADIASTRSQKAASVQDLMMKLAEAAYQRDVSNTQFGYQQQRDYIGDQNALYDREIDLKMAQLQAAQQMAEMEAASAQSGSSASEKLNPYQEAAIFAEQLQPGQGSNIIAAIQKAMNERGEIYARGEDDPVAMNPALFAKLIADYPENKSLDRNALMMVAQLLYKQFYGTD